MPELHVHVQSTAGSDAQKGVDTNIGVSWSYVKLTLKFHNWADKEIPREVIQQFRVLF